MEGMTWIHPLLSQSVNLKKLNDTIELEMPKVTRFYPDMAKLKDGTKDVHGLHWVKYNEIPNYGRHQRGCTTLFY